MSKAVQLRLVVTGKDESAGGGSSFSCLVRQVAVLDILAQNQTQPRFLVI